MRIVSVAERVRLPAGALRRDRILVQHSGRATIDQQDGRTILPPRALTVYGTARPYGVIEHGDFMADVGLVPRERPPLGAEEVAPSPVSIERGPGALFRAEFRPTPSVPGAEPGDRDRHPRYVRACRAGAAMPGKARYRTRKSNCSVSQLS
ncbi:hypothetical protein [Actinomadura rugatobispora]|uniref:Uncharacterized protein n=1 Tax=Actinomadura rugatobispora TaxID=1994 RepID=A0ABW1A1D4_9ACTN|nr:hypothetical protein GCM10010200_083480 [Actinomadura rugatobispora]